MGRQQYLTRLAVGRSAFKRLENDQVSHEVEGQGSAADQQPLDGNGGDLQRYNSRGRPINPATEVRNAEMRRAQNSILALVGVVEDRDRLQRTTEREARRMREDRQELLRAEDDRGSELDLLAEVSFPVATWWADCLIHRYMTGCYNIHQPFAEVVMTDWKAAFGGGLRGMYATIFPGAAAWTLYLVARLSCTAVVEVFVEEVSKRSWRTDREVKTQRRLNSTLQWVGAGLSLCADVLLLPLCYYASAQTLGLAPALRLLPPWRSHLPWHPTSLHHFGWKPLLNIAFLRSLTSPAALLLTHRSVVNELLSDMQTMDTPIASELTSFRYPSVNEWNIRIDKPALTRDPIGWVLNRAYDVRASFLAWCGWNLVSLGRTTSEGQFRQDLSLDATEKGYTTHRSTQLARLQAQNLAANVDRFLTKLLLLPFETLVMRAVATSYMASPLPKTPQASAVAGWLYAPFSGRLLRWLRAPSITSAMTRETGQYGSKIGLSIALHVAIQTVLFTSIYGLVRWQGVTRFGWGREGETKKTPNGGA